MRIISDFRDFYDCIQAHGQDQGFVYLRNPETLDFDRKQHRDWRSKNLVGNFWPFPRISNYGNMKRIYIREHIIGFCGKIYPVIELRAEVFEVPTICYNIDDVDKFIEENYKDKLIKEYYKSRKRYWSRLWHEPSQEEFKKFFDKCAEEQDNHEELFKESGQPLFVAHYRDRYSYNSDKESIWHPSTITFNAELKGLNFYRIFPTAIAYQEISMYLGGVLGQGNPVIPEISNNDMIEAKGFDLKTSFRKEKSKKKKRKK